MKNSKYWRDRFLILEKEQYKKSGIFIEKIDKKYRKAVNEIEKYISVWYTRFTVNNSISYSEAIKLLNSDELKELKCLIKGYTKFAKETSVNKKWIKRLENVLSKVQITRLDSLKLQIQNEIENLMAEQLYNTNDFILETYMNNYYNTRFEISKGLAKAMYLQQLDKEKVKQIISKPWASDGLDFSKRIWGSYRGGLLYYLENDFTRLIITGNEPKKLINDFTDKFRVMKNRSKNLIMTESAFFSSSARKDCMKELRIEKYELVAVLDMITSKICISMDGKIFKLSEYQIGVTAPPFHNRCRTTTAPYFDK